MEFAFYLLPLAVGDFLTADFIIEQAKVCDNLSLIFKDKGCRHTFIKEIFCVLDQEIVQILVATIKSCEFCFRR